MEHRRSDCDLLRPSLVALICDESHPELPRLLEHLLRCEACRLEEEDLRAVRAVCEGTRELWRDPRDDPWSSSVAGPRRRRPAAWARNLSGAAALAVVVALLLLPGEPGDAGREAIRAVDGLPPGGAPGPAISFGGDELDGRIARVGRELRALGKLAGETW